MKKMMKLVSDDESKCRMLAWTVCILAFVLVLVLILQVLILVLVLRTKLLA